jgi:hypothetical protein
VKRPDFDCTWPGHLGPRGTGSCYAWEENFFCFLFEVEKKNRELIDGGRGCKGVVVKLLGSVESFFPVRVVPVARGQGNLSTLLVNRHGEKRLSRCR